MKTDCYNKQESQAEAMSCAQIEADKAQLESDLYCIGMGNELAYARMPVICAALGIKFPPKQLQGGVS